MQDSQFYQTTPLGADDPLADDPELHNELALLFLEDCPKLLGEMRRAISQQDGPALRLAAHTLKGSSGVFDAQAAYACAFRMECIGKDNDWGNVEAAWDAVNWEMSRLSSFLTQQIS